MTNTHPVKNLSGAGFTFEDRVGAWMAAALLAGATPLDAELGPPTRIDFQVDADGWRLDDLLVTFAAARWCASIKSFPQIKSGAASGDFVTRAWEELRSLGFRCFSRSEGSTGVSFGVRDLSVVDGYIAQANTKGRQALHAAVAVVFEQAPA